MSSIPYFISDLHLSHKKILEFSRDYREGNTVEEHDEWIIDTINSTVKKRDILYVLGDIAFKRDGLEKCKRIICQKRLVMGNHDKFSIEEYQSAGFKIIQGTVRYKEFWLTHAPIHPLVLRGLVNIHGHVHSHSLDDKRYVNVCVENLAGKPRSLDEIRKNLVP